MAQYGFTSRDPGELPLGSQLHDTILDALEACLEWSERQPGFAYQVVEVEDEAVSRTICLVAGGDVYWPISHDSARDFITEDMEEDEMGSRMEAIE